MRREEKDLQLISKVRILAECGERSPSIAHLLGINRKTVKRYYRRAHTHVPTGRPPGIPPRWRGREREKMQELYQMWMEQALEEILSGNGPDLLYRLAITLNLKSPSQISALFSVTHLGLMQRKEEESDEEEEEGDGPIIEVQARCCNMCEQPYVALIGRIAYRREVRELVCLRPECQRKYARLSREAQEAMASLNLSGFSLE